MLRLVVKKPGFIEMKMIRIGYLAEYLNFDITHMRGSITHLSPSISPQQRGTLKFCDPYRSDKGGYQKVFKLEINDQLEIQMEVHHFASAIIGHGSTKMKVSVQYIGDNDYRKKSN